MKYTFEVSQNGKLAWVYMDDGGDAYTEPIPKGTVIDLDYEESVVRRAFDERGYDFVTAEKVDSDEEFEIEMEEDPMETAELTHGLFPDEPRDSAKSMVWNDTFHGTKLYPKKAAKIERMKKLAGFLAKERGFSVSYKDADPEHMNWEFMLDIKTPLFLHKSSAVNSFRMIVDNADSISFADLKNGGTRMAFGVHDIWEESYGIVT